MGRLKSTLIFLLLFVLLVFSLRILGSFCESLKDEIRASLEVERNLKETNSQYKIEITTLTRERFILLTAMHKLNLRRASDEDTYVIK